MKPEHISYMHLTAENGKRSTIAYRVVEDELRWGVALCHRKDTYVRKIGRELANAALASNFNRIKLITLKTLAVGVVHNRLLEASSPFTLPGVLALDEQLSKVLEDADNPFDMLSCEFFEQVIFHTSEVATLRSQKVGNLTFDLSHFS